MATDTTTDPSLHPRLKPLLERTIDDCPAHRHVDNDPVGLVRPYGGQRDREVAGLFAACLAYGRVDLLRAAIADALDPLGPNPAHRLQSMTQAELDELWPDFVYRMTRGADLRDLAAAIGATLRTEGSLEALYANHAEATGSYPVVDRQHHLEAASRFIRTLRERRRRTELHRGLRYILVDPADGSACKRLHLYFRWVVRGPDAVDMGLWDSVDPAALLMPLDTHTSRLCRYLGLLSRKTVDGKAALQTTRRLAELDADDPLRYDFALCHLGISNRCIHRRCPDRCPTCPIEPACTLPA